MRAIESGNAMRTNLLLSKFEIRRYKIIQRLLHSRVRAAGHHHPIEDGGTVFIS